MGSRMPDLQERTPPGHLQDGLSNARSAGGIPSWTLAGRIVNTCYGNMQVWNICHDIKTIAGRSHMTCIWMSTCILHACVHLLLLLLLLLLSIASVVFPGCIYPAACGIKENQRGAPCMQPCTHFFTGSTIPKIPLNRVAADLALEMW